MRVRVGSEYRYHAEGFDRFDPKCVIEPGAVVRVINLYGAPKANTMGQCYVADAQSGEFIGMVSTASLTPARVATARKAARR